MKKLFYAASLFACLCVAASCSSESPVAAEQKPGEIPAAAPMDFDTKAGVVGVFDVPEMLTLCKMDSADAAGMADKLAKDYTLLEDDARAIGAEIAGAPGVINYNNDPESFKFECVLPIKKMPAKQPAQCQIVVLEETKMLIYNHYGPYEKLLDAYNTIRTYCAEHKLKQSGPMREFYLSDPDKETDPAKWLTRVMLPVEY